MTQPAIAVKNGAVHIKHRNKPTNHKKKRESSSTPDSRYKSFATYAIYSSPISSVGISQRT